MTTIMMRRGIAADWSTSNPVLAAGEPGFELDTGKHKIGDGVSNWSELEYFLPESYLSALYTDELSTLGTPANEFLRAREVANKLYFLDAYNNFYGGPLNVWVVGQSFAPVTLTAPVSVGATVLPVSSGTGMLAGEALITGEGTANQQIHRIAPGGVSGNNLTLVAPVTYALASGSNVTALWSNASHPTNAGYSALAYFLANAKDSAGNYIITGTTPKVTLLGNSWFDNIGNAVYVTKIHDRIPGATVVNVGVSGNQSSQMLARFDTDVPADSDYVIINEPGVNDIYQGRTAVEIATNLELLVRKIRAIGAVPIYVGIVPLQVYPAETASRQAETSAQIGTSAVFPALSASAIMARFPLTTRYREAATSTLLLGPLTSEVVTGAGDTVYGYNAGHALTSGVLLSLFGYNAGQSITTATHDSFFGAAAGAGATTGSEDSGFGANVLLSLTTGSKITASGKDAGYAVGPTGDTTKATTTGTEGAFYGYRSGGSAAGQQQSAFGAYAMAQGSQSTAVGAKTNAGATGAGAIFIDSAGTGASSTTQDEVGLGTALHNIRIAGWLRLDKSQTTVGAAGAASALPATPSKYLLVKDSAGTVGVVPWYAAA